MKKTMIKDIDFHKLINMTNKYQKDSEFITAVLQGSSILNKYNVDYMDKVFFLKSVYNIKETAFKDIINKAGITKSQVSHIFCIPIRTIEDWHNEKNKCPIYTKLMFMRYFYQLDFGKNICLESEVLREGYRPKIYNKPRKLQRPEVEVLNKRGNVKSYQDEIDLNIYKSNKTNDGLRKTMTPDILLRTDYLADIIRKRKEKGLL